MQLELVDNIKALQALQTEWRCLWERCPDATPFQTPEWLLPWWQYLGGGDLFVLTLRHEGALVGMAPLFIHTWKERRQISPIGVSISDYADLLLLPKVAEQGTAMILRHLVTMRDRWDICDIPELRDRSYLLRAQIPEELEYRVQALDVCPVLKLPRTVEEFESGLAAHHRRNLRRARRLLEQGGPAQIETAQVGTLSEFVETLIRLHEARWREQDRPGVLHEPQTQAFHRQVVVNFFDRGMLRLYGLRQNGALVSVMYDFEGHDRMYAYLGGFDPSVENVSPGTLLSLHAIEQAVRDGCREYDFLRGAENHKYVWGAQNRQNYRLLMWHSTPPNE